MAQICPPARRLDVKESGNCSAAPIFFSLSIGGRAGKIGGRAGKLAADRKRIIEGDGGKQSYHLGNENFPLDRPMLRFLVDLTFKSSSPPKIYDPPPKKKKYIYIYIYIIIILNFSLQLMR